MKRYLLVVEGDVEPRLQGPYASYEERLAAARAHREKDHQMRDGLYILDVEDSGDPVVDGFGAMELV